MLETNRILNIFAFTFQVYKSSQETGVEHKIAVTAAKS